MSKFKSDINFLEEEIKKHKDAIKDSEKLIKKYQEKLYWHIRRMVVDHDDAALQVGTTVVPYVEGRTVLFVSHNLASVKMLTERCVWLERGEVRGRVAPGAQRRREHVVDGAAELAEALAELEGAAVAEVRDAAGQVLRLVSGTPYWVGVVVAGAVVVVSPIRVACTRSNTTILSFRAAPSRPTPSPWTARPERASCSSTCGRSVDSRPATHTDSGKSGLD